MQSILDLLSVIMKTPSVDDQTKTRAGFLYSRINGRAFLSSIFGGLH